MELNQLQVAVSAGLVKKIALVPDSAANCYHIGATLTNGKQVSLDTQRGALRGFKSLDSAASVIQGLIGTRPPLVVDCLSADQAGLDL